MRARSLTSFILLVRLLSLNKRASSRLERSAALSLLSLLCALVGCDSLDEPQWGRCGYALEELAASTSPESSLFKIREDTQIAGVWALSASELIGDCARIGLWSGLRSDIIELDTANGQIVWVLHSGDSAEDESLGERGEVGVKMKLEVGRWIIGDSLMLTFPLQPLNESPSRAYSIGEMRLRVKRVTYDELRGVIELYDSEREALVILGDFKLSRIS